MMDTTYEIEDRAPDGSQHSRQWQRAAGPYPTRREALQWIVDRAAEGKSDREWRIMRIDRKRDSNIYSRGTFGD